MSDICLILTTWPDEAAARTAAQRWLSENLAACVNILPTMRSLYVWNGELKEGLEHQMLVKTSRHRVDELKQAIVEAHPYECPEILQIPVEGGLEEFLDWIKGNTE